MYKKQDIQIIETLDMLNFRKQCELFSNNGYNIQSSYCGEKVWKGVFVKTLENDECEKVVVINQTPNTVPKMMEMYHPIDYGKY